MRTALVIALLLLALFIYFISGYHQWIESNYSTGFFPKLASSLRWLLGALPFSLGDVIYSVVVAAVLWNIIKFIIRLFHPKDSWGKKLYPLFTAAIILLFVYVYFYLFWGLNYYRKGIEYQLGLQNGQFQKKELISLNQYLLEQVNHRKEICLQKKDTVMSHPRMYKAAYAGYRELEQQYPFLHYRNSSIKSSLFGRLGNYVGFQGYYNPFTGEAHVNTRIPNFVQPFVTCHEMAHQIGYASESEANFVGFLAATNSPDTLMQYSAYLDIFLYSIGNLRAVDSVASKEITKQLNEGVKRDIRTEREFALKYRTFIENWTNAFYDFYLRQNRQRKGIASYNEVTGWLVAWRKKEKP
ncbi:MAG: DUF3810 domain-containing protein [Chitinophagaceae bacterium]|nr:DUF3810 domain-containing protein [Chitinophagaceae bacterium]